MSNAAIGMYLQNSNKEKRLTSSIASYLANYADTSFKKDERLLSVQHAASLLEYVVVAFEITDQSDAIAYNAFCKILTKAKQAQINRNELYDFRDEIGFLRMLDQ